MAKNFLKLRHIFRYCCAAFISLIGHPLLQAYEETYPTQENYPANSFYESYPIDQEWGGGANGSANSFSPYEGGFYYTPSSEQAPSNYYFENGSNYGDNGSNFPSYSPEQEESGLLSQVNFEGSENPSLPPSEPTAPPAAPTPTPTPTPIPTPTTTTAPANPEGQNINQAQTFRVITPTSSSTVVTPNDAQSLVNSSAIPSAKAPTNTPSAEALKEISVNFNNVAIIEFIRFISRITGKNFVFNDEDLQFNVTIVSEEPTSIENLMSALLQELKIRDLSLIEQGNTIIIHRNPRIRAPGKIVTDFGAEPSLESEIITRVFRLNTLDPLRASEIIRPLLSEDALVEILRDSNNLIITDLATNVNKIAQLIASLDAPNSGMTIGQYVVRNAFVDAVAVLAEKILQPIAQGNPFVLVPHPSTNSIFIVSNPFIVERALGILENLDVNEGRTKIFSLEKLRASETGVAGPGGGAVPGSVGVPAGELPGVLREPVPPQIPPGAIFDESREFLPGILSSAPRWVHDLPIGHIERTLFFIYKLKYRRGAEIELALRKIAASLQLTGTTNADLVAAINSSQWIETSNSLIFTGTAAALERLKELIIEVDLPLRQVFIEMLILDASISDSLSYGVEWGARFGGGNTAGAESFLSGGSLLGQNLDATASANPSPVGLANAVGYTLGVIGRHLTHNGTRFNSIGALVRAVHGDAKINIVLNPKIITEDNHTAEIFVGSTDRYKTQSISNDRGNVITNNFQFLDVGTTLRVTPLIGSNDVITLDIIEEITSDSGQANPVGTTQADVDINLVPILNKSRTLTRIHVPNGFFVILSGMIRDTRSRTRNQVPCLGGIPLIGGLAKQKANSEEKRNLMIFIRPLIIDSDEEIEYLTKRQQDVYREKTKFRRSWNYEIDEALDMINLQPTDPDEFGCTVRY